MRKNTKRYMYKKSIVVGGDKTDRNDVIKDILYYTRSIPRVVVFTDDEVSKSFFQPVSYTHLTLPTKRIV